MKIEKYGSRNWAVYDNAENLVCVTLYKKGALEVVKRLEPSDYSNVEKPKHNISDIKKVLDEIKSASSKIKKITQELNKQLER